MRRPLIEKALVVIPEIPDKLRSVIARVARCHDEDFTGSLEIHFQDGIPRHVVRQEKERL